MIINFYKGYALPSMMQSLETVERVATFILTGGSCGSQPFSDASPSDFPERTFYNYPRGPLSMLEAAVASTVVSRPLFLSRITVGTDVWNPHKGGRQESKTTGTAGDSTVQPDSPHI